MTTTWEGRLWIINSIWNRIFVCFFRFRIFELKNKKVVRRNWRQRFWPTERWSMKKKGEAWEKSKHVIRVMTRWRLLQKGEEKPQFSHDRPSIFNKAECALQVNDAGPLSAWPLKNWRWEVCLNRLLAALSDLRINTGGTLFDWLIHK